ncbi:hypothetical protein Syn7502_02062 [Synechococcus sp. PCC 7502]|uniref:hypothetical protein n=1 Tax=Synechococcus sp. PCC 7502 TaxID=1173263 RepID=UPI00029FA66C|nr:hypothetical protein [Synechococcus sp. PCC 7502]AFY74084.1 hypothetical protein Syn7502_02062 [Synechococcus sp. PCC 7502]
MTSEQTNIYFDEIEMVLMESSSLNEVLVDREVNVQGLQNFLTSDGKYFPKFGTRFDQIVPVIAVFSSLQNAERVVLALQRQGLASYQVSIVTKKELDIKLSINCENISISSEFLIKILGELGISKNATLKFANAVDDGKFLVMAIGSNREASQAQHVLENIIHCIQG